jgi:hypothetical protein
MREQINSPTPRESTTPLEGGDQVDLHAGNSELISLEELERRRRREAFQREALGLVAEKRPLAPHERLGQLNLGVVGLRRTRMEESNRDGFDLAA